MVALACGEVEGRGRGVDTHEHMGAGGLPRAQTSMWQGGAGVRGRGRGWYLRNAWLSGLVRPSSWGQPPLQAAPEHGLDAKERVTWSRGKRQTSHVTHHTSHVTRHTSHVTRHTSHVTRHLDDIFMIVAGGGNEGGPSIVVLRVEAIPAVTCHTISRRKQEDSSRASLESAGLFWSGCWSSATG